MIKQLKRIFYLISVIILISCGINNATTIESNVNTKLNTEYKKSKKAFSGELNSFEYKELISVLEKELNTNILEGKSILINYNQKASNCISVKVNKNNPLKAIEKRVDISHRISTNNNAIDFFVYTDDSYQKDIYQEKANFILDSGFFYDNVFTLHENCKAFLIIKPSGEFLKYYGEDYFSEVTSFLKTNN